MKVGELSSEVLKCEPAGIEIEDMSMAGVRARDLSNYLVRCWNCGDWFKISFRGSNLFLSQKKESGRRMTDSGDCMCSLCDNFPISLRQFIVQSKNDVHELGSTECLYDDFNMEVEDDEWLIHSFTRHILLSEFVHEEKC